MNLIEIITHWLVTFAARPSDTDDTGGVTGTETDRMGGKYYNWYTFRNDLQCIKVFGTCRVRAYYKIVHFKYIYAYSTVMTKVGHKSHFEGTKDIQYCEVPLQRGQFSPKSSQETLHSSPVRARYGVSFVNTNSGWCFASVSVFMFKIPCYVWPRYKGIRLYLGPWNKLKLPMLI